MKRKKIFRKKPRKVYLTPNIRNVDYKNIELLSKFINNHGKILNSKITGLNRIQQTNVARAIKRARYMALLPYTKERTRKY